MSHIEYAFFKMADTAEWLAGWPDLEECDFLEERRDEMGHYYLARFNELLADVRRFLPPDVVKELRFTGPGERWDRDASFNWEPLLADLETIRGEAIAAASRASLRVEEILFEGAARNVYECKCGGKMTVTSTRKTVRWLKCKTCGATRQVLKAIAKAR